MLELALATLGYGADDEESVEHDEVTVESMTVGVAMGEMKVSVVEARVWYIV